MGLLTARRASLQPHAVTPARALARPAEDWRRLLRFQHQASQAVAAADDERTLLAHILALAGGLLDAGTGVAWQRGSRDGELRAAATWAPAQDVADELARDYADRTVRLNELLAASDGLIVPLLAAGMVHGVLEFSDPAVPDPDEELFAALDVVASLAGIDLARRSEGASPQPPVHRRIAADDAVTVAVLRSALQRSREASRRAAVLAIGLAGSPDHQVAALAAHRVDELGAAHGVVLRGLGADRLVVLPDLGPDAEAQVERLATEMAGVLAALGVAATIDTVLSGSAQARRSVPAVAPLLPAAPVPDPGALAAVSLRVILDRGAIRSEYQPIVDLGSGAVVAYEALARGPKGSLLERPDLLFAAARAAGRLEELDWLCRAAALRGAGGLPAGASLFVNVEPAALGTPGPPALEEQWATAAERLHVVVEITERALTARPADLLTMVSEVRRRGWGVALDDIGADTRSLALVPLLRPDVLKLDLRLVQQQPGEEIAAIIAAVNAERERSGAVLLAEGIETEAHLATALAMGATLGQGWYLGRPAPLPPGGGHAQGHLPGALARAAPSEPECEAPRTPYEAVARMRQPRCATRSLMLAMTRQLEEQAARLGPGAVVLSAFQSADRFTAATARRYGRLADQGAFVAAFGIGMDARPAPGVRGEGVAAGDPLQGEWSVVVLGPHHGGALVATDLGHEGPDGDHRFDFALTYDRSLVVDAAKALLRRVTPTR